MDGGRLGGACGVAGGAGYLVTLVLHGDLPDGDIGAALTYVAASPTWTLIHLVGIVSVLLWVGAFTGLAHTLRAGGLGRAAVIAMAIGAGLFTVDYSVDGYALKQAADAWAAGGGEQARQVGVALVAVLGGTVSAAVTWAFGLPFLLVGLALVAEGRRTGWVAAVTGAASLVGGLAAYLGSEAGFLLSLAGSAASAIWLVVVGVLMWRRAGTAAVG